ncbi:MAG: ATP-grasp domain-containing protein [Deltaproteobacteria bacterium]|nr:ATP-grasp domain-containing protein [Deltaproteobacteria bacterium]
MARFTETVLVTGLNATDNPGPGVAVAQSLRDDPDFGGRIIGLAYDMLDPGHFLPDLFDASYLIPYPSGGREALFDRLAYIQEREHAGVLLPNLDSELPALMGQEAALGALGLRTFLPSRAQFDQRNKDRLGELRDKFGIPVPRSVNLVEVEGVYALHKLFPFPMVIKSPFYGATIVHNTDEAVHAFWSAAAQWGYPVIAQAYVEGEEVNVTALGDGRGGMVGAVAMKKMLLTDKGKGWAGVTIRDRGLLSLSEELLRVLSWRGPCEIEVRRDRQGAFHLLEINPRMPAWVDLCFGAGQNIPLATARLAAGEAVTSLPDYRVGAAFVRVSTNTLLTIEELETLSSAGERHGRRTS